jgi:penicillin-binding protein 1A
VGEQMRALLHGVVVGGTGTKAQVGEWAAGKTGTTENYGDAWFVGFTDRYTAAVWVGYPDKVKYMTSLYHGQPVAGGTYPTEIWHDFMAAAIRIDDARGKGDEEGEDGPTSPVPILPTTPAPSGPDTTPDPAPQEQEPNNGGGAPPEPAPQPEPRPDPAPPPRDGGGGQGGGTSPSSGTQ